MQGERRVRILHSGAGESGFQKTWLASSLRSMMQELPKPRALIETPKKTDSYYNDTPPQKVWRNLACGL